MDQLCHILLSLFKFIRLFCLTLLVILEQRHDEIDELLHYLLRTQLSSVISHSLHYSQSHSSSIAKSHILHEGGIVIHAQNSY